MPRHNLTREMILIQQNLQPREKSEKDLNLKYNK